jgi:hypothetical protein
MLTASINVKQEEWVQRWLDKLTPKQQALVIEVLEDVDKYKRPTQAAVAQAKAVVTHQKTWLETQRLLPREVGGQYDFYKVRSSAVLTATRSTL